MGEKPQHIGRNKLQGDYYMSVLKRIEGYYAERLVGLVVFGSFARDEARMNSDLDILIIISDTKFGNSKRIKEFIHEIEMPLEDLAVGCWKKGIWVELSPIILTQNEAIHFQPIYMDMVTDNIVLYDAGGVVKSIFDDVKKKMKRWGSRRVINANGWYWLIKPSLKEGEIINYDK